MSCKCCITFFTNRGTMTCEAIKIISASNLDFKLQTNAGFLSKQEIITAFTEGNTAITLISDSGLIPLNQFVEECDCLAVAPLITSVIAEINQETGAITITAVNGIGLAGLFFQFAYAPVDGDEALDIKTGYLTDLPIVVTNGGLQGEYYAYARVYGAGAFTPSNILVLNANAPHVIEVILGGTGLLGQLQFEINQFGLTPADSMNIFLSSDGAPFIDLETPIGLDDLPRNINGLANGNYRVGITLNDLPHMTVSNSFTLNV